MKTGYFAYHTSGYDDGQHYLQSFNAFGKQYVTGKVIIVGKCIPKAIRRYSSDIRMQVVIVTAPIKDWLRGYLPFKNISLYSLQRKSVAKSIALPVGRVNSDCTISTFGKPNQYYGYMKGKDIFVAYDEHRKSIASCKSNTVSEFGGGYIQSLQGFLQFRIQCKRYVQYTELFEERRDDSIRVPDIYLMATVTRFMGLNVHLYPQFFMDNIAFIVLNEDERMSLLDLISLINFPIWICLSFCVLLVNSCFLLIYYRNPRLQRSPKVRVKAMSKVTNIISLHGLTFFQSEWQQGPTTSSKWILFTYNILLFIFTGIYITLFTQKIFSLKTLTQFNVQTIPNSSIGFSGSPEFYYSLITKYCPFKVEPGHVGCAPSWDNLRQFKDFNMLIENLKNGNCTAVVEITAVALSVMKYFPQIGIVKDAVMEYPFSFRSNTDFDFLEIFDAVTLKMREIGVMKKLINTHLDLKFIPEPTLKPVIFALVWYMLVILGVGVVSSLIVCLIEIFIWKPISPPTRRDKINTTLQ